MPCAFFSKGSATKMEAKARVEVAENFVKVMLGLQEGDLNEFCTKDCEFQPPGSPVMHPSECAAMLGPFMASFPHWATEVGAATKNEDGTWTIETRQKPGKFCKDLPVVGPFPAVSLKEAAEIAKTTDLVFPWEIGTFTFTKDLKVSKASWAGEINVKKSKTSTKAIVDSWNKKGDLSDVGFGAIFSILGKPLANPSFFFVRHEFKEGVKPEDFWGMIGGMDEKGWLEMGEKANAHGFHNHNFLPASPAGPVLCIWEASSDVSVEDFQKYIDSDESPAGPFFVNAVSKCLPGAATPASHFKAGKPTANHFIPSEKSTGTFFWVEHEFKGEKATEEFWAMIKGMSPEDWVAMAEKNESLGFCNHYFLPGGPAGPTNCVWESKEPMTVEEFQKFIDGPDGPGAGKMFNNTVHIPMAGAKTPKTSFPKSVIKSATSNGKASSTASETAVDARVE